MSEMREIRIEKVVLNIGIGRPGEDVAKAKALLERLTGRKIIGTKTRRRTTFGVPRGREIGCKVTLRGQKAIEFLKKALLAKDNKLPASSFGNGHFSFGIEEYIDIPGIAYDPSIGILGLDVCVSLERPGYRVKRRKIKGKIGKRHLIRRDETIDFIKRKFGVEVV